MNGTLEIIAGPMFAGKTTLLIERLRQQPGSLLVRHRDDSRFPDPVLRTHNGAQPDRPVPCFRVDAAGSLLEGWRRDRLVGAGIGPFGWVAIEEAQFFDTHGLLGAVEEMLRDGAQIILVGLQYDYLRIPLRWLPALSRFAASITLLRGQCAVCGDWTEFQHRQPDGKLLNGTSKDFDLRCIAHFE